TATTVEGGGARVDGPAVHRPHPADAVRAAGAHPGAGVHRAAVAVGPGGQAEDLDLGPVRRGVAVVLAADLVVGGVGHGAARAQNLEHLRPAVAVARLEGDADLAGVVDPDPAVVDGLAVDHPAVADPGGTIDADPAFEGDPGAGAHVLGRAHPRLGRDPLVVVAVLLGGLAVHREVALLGGHLARAEHLEGLPALG